jgi:rod shape-determining protein MreB
MIVNIGGGTSEIAVVALGGIVTSQSIRMAGDKMDDRIADYIRKEHNLAIGSQSAEEIKIRIGRAFPQKREDIYDIRGRDLVSGLPRNIKISSNEIAKALQSVLEEIIEGIKQVLRQTPPELSADIINKGMILSGGGALLRDLDQLVAKHTGVPCFTAEDALFCVIRGTGVVLENLDDYKRSVMSKK